MAAPRDAWAALLAQTLVAPGRPHPQALTMMELAKRLRMSHNGARQWADRQATAGRVRLVQGRHVTSNKPTVYVVPTAESETSAKPIAP